MTLDVQDPMLQVQDLRSGYGSLDVLRGITLDLAAGSVVAVLGANGAGKTTLVRTIAGLVPARAGRVTFEGRDVTRDHESARARAGLCLVPEGRGIFRQLSVEENVAMYVRGRGARAAFDRAASIFPVLGQRRSQLAGTLSGGEQQMLAVSRALVTGPRVVMVDELSVGLAPVIIDDIYAAVDLLRAEGVALLIVEQYVDRVLERADHVVYLRKGEIVFRGGADDLRRPEVLDRLHLGVPVGGAA